MGNKSYTPGPWTAACEGCSNIFGEILSVPVLDSGGFAIAEIQASPILHKWKEIFPEMEHWADGANAGLTQKQRPNNEVLGNAHLIAAAPELLAALLMIQTDKDEDGCISRDVMEQVNAAIRAATGETQ